MNGQNTQMGIAQAACGVVPRAQAMSGNLQARLEGPPGGLQHLGHILQDIHKRLCDLNNRLDANLSRLCGPVPQSASPPSPAAVTPQNVREALHCEASSISRSLNYLSDLVDAVGNL